MTAVRPQRAAEALGGEGPGHCGRRARTRPEGSSSARDWVLAVWSARRVGRRLARTFCVLGQEGP